MRVYWLSWSGPHTVPAEIPETLVYWRKGWDKTSTTYCARLQHPGDMETAWIELARYFPGANLCVRHAQQEYDESWWPHPKRYPPPPAPVPLLAAKVKTKPPVAETP